MRVDGLPGHAFAGPDVACEAAIRRFGIGGREMLLPIRVAADAEVHPSHGAEAETMLIEMARRAQAATELARGRVADEPPAVGRRHDESVPAESGPRRAVAVERVWTARGEVPAGERLLELRLVAAPARRVPYRLREVGMVAPRVTLPAPDPHGRVPTCRVLFARSLRVAGRATLHVHGRSRVSPGSASLR